LKTIEDRIKTVPPTKLIPLIIFAILMIIVPVFASGYILFVAVLALLYASLAASYDLLFGYTGQLSFCHGAFYGIGAYTAAILTVRFGFTFWEALIPTCLLVGVLATIIGYPALRLRGAYFAVTTFFLAHFIYLILLNEVELTGGPLGFRGINPPEPIGFISFDSLSTYYYLVVVFFIIVVLFLYTLVNSNLGLILISIREDEVLAESMGINTAVYKLLAFVIGAVIAGLAGAFFAHFFRLLHPTTFSWLLSEMVVIITLVGGAGTLIGPIFGAGIVTFLLEFLRFAPELRYVGWAAALIVILIFEPKGLIGLLERVRAQIKKKG